METRTKPLAPVSNIRERKNKEFYAIINTALFGLP
jgi:hypothetical protein